MEIEIDIERDRLAGEREREEMETSNASWKREAKATGQ